jgi:hypothetical protein
VKATTYQIRYGEKLAIAVKLNGFDRSVIHHLAMRTFAEMLMQDVL